MYEEKKIIGNKLHVRINPSSAFRPATGPIADAVNTLLIMDNWDRSEVLRLIKL